MSEMRLQRFLARAGVVSRRKAEPLIVAGRVCVNGTPATELGTKVDPDRDTVTLDGEPISLLAEENAYVMLYKPRGYESAMSGPGRRPYAGELVPTDRYPGLFHVGRLDWDTTGLLLFTTDGEVGHALTHPSHEVDKHYVALVRGVPSRRELEVLRRGLRIDKDVAAPAEGTVLDADDPACRPVIPEGLPYGCSVVGLTIHEGKKHEVKRLLGAVGHKVIRLHRDKFGPLVLCDVAPGAWRDLTADEVRAVREAAR